MDVKGIVETVGNVVNATLFKVGTTPVSLATLATVCALILLTFWLSWLLRRGMRGALNRRGVATGTIGAINRLLHYVVLITGLSVAVQTVGFNLSALFAAGAVFAVALGFAMQNIAQNFVSGVILLVERVIKPGDILEVQDQIVQVMAMRIRTTIVRSRDGEDLVVPNSILVQSTVKNFTLQDSVYRVRAQVGVIYASDMALVDRVLRGVAEALPWRLESPAPQVLMTGFGDNSVNFEVAVWMSDPWEARPCLSRLHWGIWNAFKEASIVIAFPQLDVHFDLPVSRGFERLSQPLLPAQGRQ